MFHSPNMNKETMPKRKKLLPEGWRTFKFLGVKQGTSKSGNPMFIFLIRDEETQYEESVYAIDVEGKRGFLKMILSACGVSENSEGSFDWDESSVAGKSFQGLVEQEDNEYINREGETIRGKQHRIVEISSLEWKE